jgi:hypothetical protein
LGEINSVEEVVLAHRFKTRRIADAQIKTDRLDARALATLLRSNRVATVHAPSRLTRTRKHVIRQRMSRWQSGFHGSLAPILSPEWQCKHAVNKVDPHFQYWSGTDR